MKTIYIILFTALTLIFSCEKPPPTTYNYLSQEIKDYMYFKKGTYWIYRDVNTNKEDSVWVDSAYFETKCYSLDNRSIKSINCDEIMYIKQRSSFNDSVHMYMTWVDRTSLYLNDQKHEIFNNIFSVKPNSNLPNSNILYKDYSLLGKEYKNVSYKDFGTNIQIKIWTAQNIGFVRLEGYIYWYGFFSTPCDLQLVRYKIVQ